MCLVYVVMWLQRYAIELFRQTEERKEIYLITQLFIL